MLFGIQILGLTRRRARVVALSLACLPGLMALGGCGQKGPLYLPAPAEPPAASPTTSPTSR